MSQIFKAPKLIKKPWSSRMDGVGEEWLALNDYYCYKRIFIKAGQKTSLQYHEQKLETNYLIEGQAILWLGMEGQELSPNMGIISTTKHIIGPGDFFTIPPMTLHQIEAVTNTILQEVSTPHVDDCIRIQDDTNRPNGRIEDEHSN